MTEPWNADGVVVARAIAGDRDVLDDILAALQRPLYRYISRLLTHRETAEDALQEVLFRICRKIVWLRDPELLRPGWQCEMPRDGEVRDPAARQSSCRFETAPPAGRLLPSRDVSAASKCIGRAGIAAQQGYRPGPRGRPRSRAPLSRRLRSRALSCTHT